MSSLVNPSYRPQVVIIGAGFGGLKAASVLAKAGVSVLLLDRNNYHTFVPLLYQVATAELEPEQIAYPVRSFLRGQPNVSFLQAEVRQVDFLAKTIETDREIINYDFLILATGSQSQFLGVPGAATYALPMRSLCEAIALRNHVLSCFEQAVHEPSPTRCQQLLTFIIVGGGPTGVELAGGLIELIQGALVSDYPELNLRRSRVILLQSNERLLASFPQRLGAYTQKQLRKMGVKIHLNSKVRKVTSEAVYLEDDTIINAETIIWTAGVEANAPETAPAVSTAMKGKLVVQPTLQLRDHPQVYAIGDLAYLEQDGKPLVGVAPVAIQQGVAAAKNIARQLRGLSPQPFNYVDKGRAAIIGRNAGVVQARKFSVTGFPAWLVWLSIHLFYLPGWRNRLSVLVNWICDYLLKKRFVCLILPKPRAKASPRLFMTEAQTPLNSRNIELN